MGFVHTSPAVLEPLMRFYAKEAPELEITNLLDDGILRLFAAGDSVSAQQRLADMLTAAAECYRTELAVLTCSAVPGPVLAALRQTASFPLLKIDEPMARMAVQAARRIGVVVSFAPTLDTTRRLLTETAAEAKKEIDLVATVRPEAYEALLSGQPERHDQLLLEAIAELRSREVQALVLAQVSMARLLPRLQDFPVPVFSSLASSLAAIREALNARVHSP